MTTPAQPEILEGEVVESNPLPESQTLVTQPPVNVSIVSAVMDMQMALKQQQELDQIVKDFLVEGTEGEGDYGTLPGTKKKCLHQPGAHKLAKIYGLAPTFPAERRIRNENWTLNPPLFDYEITCVIMRKGTPWVVAEGIGSCSSYESKYRYRKEERTCPECGTAAIIKGKQEYGGGWLCWRKKDGCSAKFNADDERIMKQQVGRVVNEDIADQKNTVLKIAAKRALVTAVITATASSHLFTPDMEHAEGPNTSEGEESSEKKGDQDQKADRKAIRSFKGQVLEMTERKRAGEPVLRMRIKGTKLLFWVADKAAIARLQGIPVEKLKKDGVAIGAVEKKGTSGKFWEVVELQRVPGKPDPGPQAVADQMVDAGNKATVGAEVERQQEKPKAAPKAETKAEPAPQAQVTDTPVLVWRGRGKEKKQVEEQWKRCIGRVRAVSGILRTTRKSQYVQVVIEGLPGEEGAVNGQYVPYCLFRAFHGSLFEVLQQSKGKAIDFLFTLDLREGTYFQMLEEVNFMDGQRYVDGKAEVSPAETAKAAPTAAATSPR